METPKKIPERVREYLGSPKVINTIENLGIKTGIPFPSLLPAIVFDVVSGKIDPAKLKESIKERIKLRDKKINTIALEIKERILRPVQNDLKNAGVDIEKIDVAGALSLVEFIKSENELLRSIGEEPEFDENEMSLEPETRKSDSISLEVFAPEIAQKKDEESVMITTGDPKKTPDSSPAPFVLHREKPPVGAATFPGSKKPAQASSKSFSLPFGFFKPKEAHKPTGPVRVKVELPEALKKTDEKTIHYSELRTPLYPFQKETQFIRTEKPKTPIDILSKKEPGKEPEKNRGVVIRNFIMNIPTGILPKQIDEKKPLPPPIRPLPPSAEEPPKKNIPEKKKIVEGGKAELTGKGFFWKTKKNKEGGEKPFSEKNNGEKAATLEGNRIDLRQ